MTYKNLIFDMDNTLSDCSRFYIEQALEFAERQSARTGLDVEFIRKVQSKIDVEFTPLPGGFLRSRFPRSFAATSAAIDIMLGNEVDEMWMDISYIIGDKVFDALYPLYSGVMETLELYKFAGFNLFVLSKGDLEVQMRKIEMNSLEKIFDRNHIYIVGHKNPEDVERVIEDHHLTKSETIFIGDSVRDDIGSALGAGIDCILVTHQSLSGQWEYENKAHTPTFSIHEVNDLPTIIPLP
jgi:FMN phosphatase YigB (HAD superfamily)